MTNESHSAETGQARYASFAQLRQAHTDLMRELERDRRSSIGDDADATLVRAFVAKATNTGAILERDAERHVAQNMLDYWSAEIISTSKIDEKEWAPAKLVEFDPTTLQAAGADAPISEAEAARRRRDARKQIQVAAAARLWNDSEKAQGYLLKGEALAEAARFRGSDKDIEALCAASEAAIRREWRNRAINLIVAAASAVIVGAYVWQLYGDFRGEQDKVRQERQKVVEEKQKVVEEKKDAEYAVIVTKQVVNQQNADLKLAKDVVGDLQKRIEGLQRQLLVSRVSLVEDSASTEAISRNAAQFVKLATRGIEISRPEHQEGFIWIGSDAEGKSNLRNPATNAPVTPKDVVANTAYRVIKNLVFRAGAPDRERYISTDSLGVIPEGTLVTAVAAAEEPYSRPTGKQYWLKVQVERSPQPVVYFQYASAPAASAQQFSQTLQQRGYRIPGVEATDLAKSLNEVRFYYPDDKEAAAKLARDTSAALRERYPTMAATKDIDLTAKRGARNFPGVIELWLDLPASAQ
ncbi:MAG: hypothetical protein HY056_11540 [Proteobacteria bacterium]|nr:hypothetical protein [Pseudomonadota bacterium]